MPIGSMHYRYVLKEGPRALTCLACYLMEDALRRKIKTWPLVFILLFLVSGCRTRRIRTFEESKGPETFENWQIGVHIKAKMYQDGTLTPENHKYRVWCSAWTVDGDVHRGPSSFRESAYFARFDSIKITYLRGDDFVELPLDNLPRPESNDPSCSVSLEQRNLIEIPSKVKELQATVTMTFTNKKTSKAENKVFKIKMKKREGNETIPLLD